VRCQFRVQRSSGQALFLKFAKPCGEPREGGLAKLDQRLLKPRVDGGGLAQHHTRRVMLAGEIFQPAPEARFEDRPRAERSGLGGCGVERFECALGSVMKVVEDRQQDALFAIEVQIERASRNACPRDDVRDGGAPVSLSRKDPRSSI
jgi:hypothetical protein